MLQGFLIFLTKTKPLNLRYRRVLMHSILVLVSGILYINLLHHRLFFQKPMLSGVDSRFLSKGREVRFRSGDIELAGSIFTNAQSGEKVPLLVFCVGSGVSSYKASYAKFIDSFFLHNVPLDSIAILCFDKRGIGASGGDWFDADFTLRARDALAAAQFGATLPFVDSGKIFVAGHSQGGWIAQICVSRYPDIFKGGISMAGPTFSVNRQLVNDYWSAKVCQGIPPERALRLAKRSANVDFTFTALLPATPLWMQLKTIRNFDPSNDIAGIKNPFLFMFAENDGLVEPAWCRQELETIFPEGMPSNIDTVTVQGSTHSFKLAPRCADSMALYSYAPTAKRSVADWLREWVLFRSDASGTIQ